jgi:hypothetical protein
MVHLTQLRTIHTRSLDSVSDSLRGSDTPLGMTILLSRQHERTRSRLHLLISIDFSFRGLAEQSSIARTRNPSRPDEPS